MLEKEFAGALAVNNELESEKKAMAESLLKATSTVLTPPRRFIYNQTTKLTCTFSTRNCNISYITVLRGLF